ncbi:MAG TPA: translation initiation factor IF-2 associated domain-containing protein, partial [Pseudolabrys sp.]|nr:translation initiation factor IF-2 associated domain-containing protein [Pseudolabrys sp.]
MTETKNPGEKKLSVGGPKLSLKPRTETGVVRQSFSHGRSKQVVVETVKRRTIAPGAAPRPEPVPEPPKKAAAPAARAPAPEAPKKPSGVVLRTLTEEERNARAHALADSRVREAEERRQAEQDAQRRSVQEAHDIVEREAAIARKRDEDERRKHDEETKRKADEVAKKRLGGETTETRRPGATTPAAPGARPTLEAEEEEAPARRRGAPGRPVTPPRPAPRVGAEKQRGR